MPEKEDANAAPTGAEVTSTPKARRSTAKKTDKQRLKKTQRNVQKAEGAKRGPRPFPAETLEEALRVPTVLKQVNAGNAWSPAEVANALGMAARGDKMWYLTASARDYGLTLGSRDTETIELAPIGRDLLYAASPEGERESAWRAFFNVPVFKSVYEYYKGGPLPDLKYLQNTLESHFAVPPKYHDEFVRIFRQTFNLLKGMVQARFPPLPLRPRITRPLHTRS